jgi:predicted enzyme related to lactoylglutathione lyase
MTTGYTAPVGAPCWIDLMSSDTDRSRAFYSELLGWSAEEPNPDFGGYFNFTKDGGRVAGCMAFQPGMGDGPSDAWSVYLNTDDARKTLDAASANGAQIHVDAMAVGDLGTMGILADPGGAVIGLWQPGEFSGLSAVAETGHASWFELLTRDYDKTIAFYRDVFRWDTETVSDTPEFRYTMLKDGETGLAGVMDGTAFLPEGVPAHWSVYFGVTDTDATVAKAVELGGAVVSPAEDTPYGRLAVATDPNGATFKLVAPNEAMPG